MFFRAYISLAVIMVMTFLPTASVVATIILIPDLKFSINSSYDYQTRNANCGIRIVNGSYSAFLRTILTVRVDNTYYNLSNHIKDVISIHSGDNFQNLSFDISRCGKLRIVVENIEIYDLMGFIKVRIPLNEETVLDIMPQLLDNDNWNHSGLLLGMSSNEDETRKGNEYSDISNIREYIPGDRIKDIHWKLSAKKDLLLVKERIKSCENQMVILLESSSDISINEDILALFYTICNYCIKEGILIKTYYYNKNNQEYGEYVFGSIAECDNCISMIYSNGISDNANDLLIDGSYIKVGLIKGQVTYEVYEGTNA